MGNLQKITVNRRNKEPTFVFENLKQSAGKIGFEDNFKLYQNNDPQHKACKARSWLLYNYPKVIEPLPQSPFMNSIENMWNELDHRVRQIPVSSSTESKKKTSGRKNWQ